jgi:hypothetical protein
MFALLDFVSIEMCVYVVLFYLIDSTESYVYCWDKENALQFTKKASVTHVLMFSMHVVFT